MIEIEKKFLVTPAQEKRLKKGARFVGEKVFTDTYFDKRNYELTSNDIWLRVRDKQVELKMPIEIPEGASKTFCNRYEEFVGEEEVRQMLNIPKGGEFLIDLKAVGFVPIVSITTRREKFKLQQFSIDIDACDFGYSIVEVELLIEKEDDVAAAELQISTFAKKQDLTLSPIRGKVIEYLYRKSPDHYRVLKEAGIIIE